MIRVGGEGWLLFSDFSCHLSYVVPEGVAGRIEVYVDGGIRRGKDVMRALALGATAVFIGRPVRT